ncbi:hypothetical protein Kisp01_38500 [Kineosporia sp. NBRC 101677]|nr:hypothetical protein Kisp01_38500 [Kineosporia sp. NBRC 101677]
MKVGQGHGPVGGSDVELDDDDDHVCLLQFAPMDALILSGGRPGDLRPADTFALRPDRHQDELRSSWMLVRSEGAKPAGAFHFCPSLPSQVLVISDE